jgi:hypothetical protein
MRWPDRIVGIVVGLILGVGVVAVFVFVFSEQTVDAPSLSGGRDGTAESGAGGAGPSATPVATVRVIGGGPPPSGPAQLHYRRGDLVRLRVLSDGPVRLQLRGYGIARTATAQRPTPIRFKASLPGNFPLLVTGSHVAVAGLRVGGDGREVDAYRR